MNRILYSVLIAILFSTLVYYFPYYSFTKDTTRLIIVLFYVSGFLLGIFLKYGIRNKRKQIRDIASGLMYGVLLSLVYVTMYVLYEYISYRG